MKSSKDFYSDAIAVCVAIVVAGLLLLMLIDGIEPDRDYSQYDWKEYTVCSGDTLWEIVREDSMVFEGEDMSSMCSILCDVNHITSDIRPGQVIYIPIGGKEND